MSDTGRRAIVLGFVVATLILLVGMLSLLGVFGVGLAPGRSNPPPAPAEVLVSSRPTGEEDDLERNIKDSEAVVKRLGGRLYIQEFDKGFVTYFVDVSGAQFESKQLEGLSTYQGVVKLRLSSTKTDDDGLKFVGRLKNLRSLELDSTLVTDKGMASISNLKDLRVLNLSKTQVTGKGLAQLGNLGKLEELELSFTPIHGHAFEPLGKLSGLKRLNLDESQTTYNALRVFEGLESLEEVWAWFPSKGGNIADVWSRGGLESYQKPYWKSD